MSPSPISAAARSTSAGIRASSSAPSAGSPARGFGWLRAATREPAAALGLVLLHAPARRSSGALAPEVLGHG